MKKRLKFGKKYTPVILALRRAIQEDQGFEASLGFTVGLYLKGKKKVGKEREEENGKGGRNEGTDSQGEESGD